MRANSAGLSKRGKAKPLDRRRRAMRARPSGSRRAARSRRSACDSVSIRRWNLSQRARRLRYGSSGTDGGTGIGSRREGPRHRRERLPRARRCARSSPHATTRSLRSCAGPGRSRAGSTAVAGDLGDAETLRRAVAERAARLRRPPRGRDRVAARRREGARGQRRGHAAAARGLRRGAAARASSSPRRWSPGTPTEPSSTRTPSCPSSPPTGARSRRASGSSASSGLDAVIIRPSHVYGPGGWYEQEFVKRLRAAGPLRGHRLGRELVGHGPRRGRRDRAASTPPSARPPGSLYHVVDDEPISYYDFALLTTQALGVGQPAADPGLARAPRRRAPTRSRPSCARRAAATPASSAQLGWEPRFASSRDGVPDAIAAIGAGRRGSNEFRLRRDLEGCAPMATDEELVRSLRDGDEDAFAELVDRHSGGAAARRADVRPERGRCRRRSSRRPGSA